MSTIEWRWVDVDGTEHVVGVDELAGALSASVLPPHVLVWRTGLLDWHPASSLEEFAGVLGARATARAALRADPGATVPPPPPADRYAALGAAKPATLIGPQRAARSPADALPRKPLPPPRAPGSQMPRPPLKPGPPGRPPAPSAPRPPPVVAEGPDKPAAAVPPPPAFVAAAAAAPAPAPIPIRDVMPTLAEEEPTRSPTLRPVGALPPPPRTIPNPRVPSFDGSEDTPLELAETEPAPVLVGEPEPNAFPAPEPAPLAGRLPGEKAASLATTARSEGAPPAAPSRAPAPTTPVAAAQRRRPREPATVAGLSRDTFTLATGISLLLPGTVLLVLALLRPRSHKDAPEPAVSAAPAASNVPSPPIAPVGCTLEKPAQKLADTASLQVPLLVASSREGRAVVGLAQAKDHALGLLIDPATLMATSAFDSRAAGPILGVVPLVRSGDPAFAVDVTTPGFSFSRTIDAKIRFALGITAEGVSRRMADATTAVWPGKSDNPTITTPRIAELPGFGYAVTFRHGGQEGKVLVGWLDEKGEKKSELKAVATDAALAGTPTISANERAALVAFAAKTAPTEPYRVELSLVPRGEAPGPSRPFVLPPGGPGGEGISPSSEGLPGGRFLLQWTEGSAGNRAVRAQVMTGDLVPVGDPITLSTPEQNAGQGALWVGGGRALALYLSKNEASHELWGASLRCP